MNTKWTRVDASDIDMVKGGKKGHHNVNLEVSMSPYDIPLGVRGFYCSERKQFKIEFQYLTSEPSKDQKLSDHVTAIVGKESGRLYGLWLDTHAMNASEISLNLQPLIKEAIGTYPEDRESAAHDFFDRSEINKRVLEQINERYVPRLAGV